MSPRHLALYASLATVVLVGGMVWAIANTSNRGSFGSSAGNPLSLCEDCADKLDLFDTREAFAAGRSEFVSIVPSARGAAVVLNDTRDTTFPRRGAWISNDVVTEFPFEELIPSYNARTPPDTGVRLQIAVRDARNGEWSPWLYMGQWGRTIAGPRDDRPVTTFSGGEVKIDVLTLSRPADAYRVRVSLQSFSPDASVVPSLYRAGVVYSGPVADALRERLRAPPAYIGRWDRTLAVPFIPQGDSPPALVGEVCSPTSVTMVLNYAGVVRSLTENSLAIYDDEHRIFGNWARAVQRAGELGLDAWITRFRTWEQVQAQIAVGQPVIASIRFEKGAMPNNPIYQDTNGHLIVIKGFTPDGDVIVNDPASREKGNGVIYKSAELANAWFAAGGVAYIIRTPAQSGPATRPS